MSLSVTIVRKRTRRSIYWYLPQKRDFCLDLTLHGVVGNRRLLAAWKNIGRHGASPATAEKAFGTTGQLNRPLN